MNLEYEKIYLREENDLQKFVVDLTDVEISIISEFIRNCGKNVHQHSCLSRDIVEFHWLDLSGRVFHQDTAFVNSVAIRIVSRRNGGNDVDH